MKPTRRLILFGLVVGIVASLGTSCALYYSRKGVLKMRIQNFNAAIDRKDWDRVREMFHEDFSLVISDATLASVEGSQPVAKEEDPEDEPMVKPLGGLFDQKKTPKAEEADEDAGETVIAGEDGRQGFIDFIDERKPTGLVIHVKKIEKVPGEDKEAPERMVATVMFQAQQGDATGSANSFWDATMLWEYSEKESDWFLVKIRFISSIRTTRS